MHLPMTPKEIADFLEIQITAVFDLIEAGKLRRTICCPYRHDAALNWSSVYDVLEYALTCGRLSFRLTPELASAWVFLLAEADELACFEQLSTSDQAAMLLEMKYLSDLQPTNDSELSIAYLLLCTRSELMVVCSDAELQAA